jgi:agmatinase
MSKEQKIKNFDTNNIGQKNAGMFGLPFTVEECAVVLVPVPWEVTVSYGGGTAEGPAAIYEASYQVDLFDPVVKDAWKMGIGMLPINEEIKSLSDGLRSKAEECIDLLANGETDKNNSSIKIFSEEIRQGCLQMNDWVKTTCLEQLKKNKVVGLIGGDHSTPLGMIQALSEIHDNFGVLQIDAHADLRNSYEGFEFSHASIMFNALKTKNVSKLVQVGIRDYCDEEYDLIQSSDNIITFFDRDIKHTQYRGDSFDRICNRIVNALPDKIYLSFDIDGLDPKLCPNTGTPVAGGFETEEVLFLIEKVMHSGKTIIGFDINEVCPSENDEWDANVASRLLYRISNMVAKSQGKI